MISKLQDKEYRKEKIKAFFRGSTWKETLIFLFFLLLALGFWMLITLQQPFEMEFPISINYKNTPPGIILSEETPFEVNIKIRDKGAILVQYNFTRNKKDQLDIDLSNLDKDKSTYTISKRVLETEIEKRIPSSALLISAFPDVLNIKYQILKKKLLPIYLHGSLEPSAGYILVDSTLFSPEIVTAYGPEENLDSINAIYTEEIHIKNIHSLISKKVSLTAPKGTILEPKTVDLNISAEAFTEKKITVPVHCINLPENYNIRIFPSSVEITCISTLADYDRIKDSDFTVIIDYRELIKQTDYKVLVKLSQKPDWIKGYKIHPEKVEFLLEEKN